MKRIHVMYGCVALMSCGGVDTYELQDTPPEKKEGPTAVDDSNTENNNGDNDSSGSGQNPDGANGDGTNGDGTNENTPDDNNENREPASEPSIEPEIPSYIGGYNVNPCTTEVQPSGYGIGQVAGDFQLVDQYGETLRLSDFCGNTVVLIAAAFW